MATHGRLTWEPPSYKKGLVLGDANQIPISKEHPGAYSLPDGLFTQFHKELELAFDNISDALGLEDSDPNRKTAYETGVVEYKQAIKNFEAKIKGTNVELLQVNPLRTESDNKNLIRRVAITFTVSGDHGKQYRSSNNHLGHR